MQHKPYIDLSPDDLVMHPVWEFVPDSETTKETLVSPVVDLPVDNLANRVVGTKVRFADGTPCWALIQNIDTKSAESTRHLLSLTLMHQGRRIFLARYHDFNQKSYGPSAMARALGSDVERVFPISYDVSQCCVGDHGALVGNIEADPENKISRDEIFQLIVKGSR